MKIAPAPYAYRDDAAVPAFDDGAPLLIFDGHCVLCSAGVQWMLERDPRGATRFATISEPIARALYRHYGLDPDAFDTFMVLKAGVPYLRWHGICAAGRLMPAPWKWLGAVGRAVPTFIGDKIYDVVQRNRIRWFGERAVCFAPDDAARQRFLLTV